MKFTRLPENIESVTDIASIVAKLPKDRRFLFRGQTVNDTPPSFCSRNSKEKSSEEVFKIEKKNALIAFGSRAFLFSKDYHSLRLISIGFR